MKHYCHRCGLESRCHASWFQTYPGWTVVLSVFVGLPLLMFFVAVLGVYPLTGTAVIALAALTTCGLYVDREYKRSRALKARAEWDYQKGIR